MNIQQAITTLSNHGIAYKGEADGRHLFAGMANGYKAAFNLEEHLFHVGEEADPNFVVDAILSDMNFRRAEWSDVGLEEVPEAEQMVAMRTGPLGGYHVQIDGVWMRVRKEEG